MSAICTISFFYAKIDYGVCLPYNMWMDLCNYCNDISLFVQQRMDLYMYQERYYVGSYCGNINFLAVYNMQMFRKGLER